MNKTSIWKKMAALSLAIMLMWVTTNVVMADGKELTKADPKDSAMKMEKGHDMRSKMSVKWQFDDVLGGDVEWAAKNIASLASRKVFEGYEDGSFQPRKPIRRVEAITAAVRLMGLEDQAKSKMDAVLNVKDADQVPSWAIGYVAVAIENDLLPFKDGSVQSEKSASRIWTTIMLVKALKLENEALQNQNTILPFKDAQLISADAVGYVKVAIDRGLINGYEDQTFRPERPVTRAEVAALLDRTSDHIPDKGTIVGQVSGIAEGSNVITVMAALPLEVKVDPVAFIYRDGMKVTLSAVKVGDLVKINTYNNVAIFIEVTKKAPNLCQGNGTMKSEGNPLILDITRCGAPNTK